MTGRQRARRPMSYADASDTGPCEGWQASPSNPTGPGQARAKEPLSETFVFRCTAQEKATLRGKAKSASLPASELLREALWGTRSRRRKPVVPVDPLLIRGIGKIGGNMNQIAARLNSSERRGFIPRISAMKLYACLVSIERLLAALVDAHRRPPGC